MRQYLKSRAPEQPLLANKQEQISLRRHGFGRIDFEFARLAATMKSQRLTVTYIFQLNHPLNTYLDDVYGEVIYLKPEFISSECNYYFNRFSQQ